MQSRLLRFAVVRNNFLRMYMVIEIAVTFALITRSLMMASEGASKGGLGPPWILKISAKKRCFLSFEWKKHISSLLAPPTRILEKSLSGPLEKSFRRP